MAVVLIRMRFALLLRAVRGGRGVPVVIGGILAALAATGTLLVGFAVPLHSGDLLAGIFALWALGWMAGPLFVGGGEGELRPEYFTRVPLTSRRLATGLLAAGFTGIGPIATVLAFAALIGLGTRDGLLATAVAVVAVLAQAVLLVVASRVVIGLMGEVMRTRFGAVLIALPWAVVIATVCDLGIVLFALGESDLIATGMSDWMATTVRALPSGWSVAAVEAAARGDWLNCLGVFAAFAAATGALFGCWVTLLRRRVTVGSARPTRTTAGLLGRALPATPLAAVIGKELRGWSRDPLRSYYWYFAITLGLLVCLIPLTVGLTAYLPWAGAAITVMAAAGAANLYAADGTALWLTLSTGTARLDVRGRQLAWLLRVVPVVIPVTVAGTAAPGQGWAWPWTLSLQATALGVGAGALVLLSVARPVKMPDAHRRGGNPAVDGGNLTGLVWAVIGITAAATIPAAAAILAGIALGAPILTWAGVPVGLATGWLSTVYLGRAAYRRLETAGPELLQGLRTGRRPEPRPVTAAPAPRPAATHRSATATPSAPAARRRGLRAGLCFGTGWIPLLSATLSIVNLVHDTSSKTLWTFPLLLPGWLRIPVIGLVAGAGLLLLAGGLLALRKRPNRKDHVE